MKQEQRQKSNKIITQLFRETRKRPKKSVKQEQNYQTFKSFLKTSKEKQLIDKMVNFYGKNYCIKYNQKYSFAERWQKQVNDNDNDNELLQDIHPATSLLCLITVITNIYTIWALSVHRYFGIQYITKQCNLYTIMLALKIIEISTKIGKKYFSSEQENYRNYRLSRHIYKEVICVFYFLYLFIFGISTNPFELIFELIITFLLYKQSAIIYQKFKVSGWAIKFENQIKIAELLFNIFIEAHIFAIFLYLSARINPTDNWTTSLNIDHLPLLSQYIYSYYFACTTILTIGYGDITPKDEAEVLIVILIEIVGVLSFGFLLNEMGFTLSKMRQKQQQLEKDLQTVSKMAKYYNLQKKLQNRAKHFLLNNQMQTDSLKPSDENRLFMKLNDDLRTQITNQNSLSIIKSCIFFLCHWSKGFQTEIAKRLQKKLISPTESLGDSKIQRIYIIKQGKVEIFLSRFGSNQNQKKLLKEISITPLQEVSDNIFGYTSAFSNRPVYLQAIAKDFTATYSISKERFLECVNLDKKDFEYYHEVKCRIDQAPFCEEWEVPAINNIREHYSPSRFFLIKKKKIKQLININKRCPAYFGRRKKKQKNTVIPKMRIVNGSKQAEGAPQTLKTLQFQNININQQEEKSKIQEESCQSGSQASVEEEQTTVKVEDGDSDSESIALEHARDWIRSYRTVLALDEKDNKQKIAYGFEMQKEYSNFFPKNNISHVLLKYESENCMQKRVSIFKEEVLNHQ